MKGKNNINNKTLFRKVLSIDLPFSPNILKDRKIISEDKKLIKYADGSVYHKDNRLNNLTNKEWLKFQKSWFILKPKPRKENEILHPAKFPEDLVSDFIKFFTKEGATVLDPMVGTGSTLISCVQTGRNGIGIELSEKYAEISRSRLEKLDINDLFSMNYKRVNALLYVGDALNIDALNLKDIDYCITSPPYWDMLREKGFETQSIRKQRQLDVFYSNSIQDLGNISDYDEFLGRLVEIYLKVFKTLKYGAYITIIVKNIKKKGKVYPLAWDLARELGKYIELKDEKIWCQDDVKLAPYGYKNAWVSNTVHHYCLNFRKKK